MDSSVKQLQERFDIKALKDHLFEGLFHFQATDKQTGALGTGSATDETTALLKAVHESVERSIFRLNKKDLEAKSSSGFACHFSVPQAQESALCEVIERDAFFVSWLLKRPPVWLPETETLALINRVLKPEGLRIKSGRIATSSNYKSVVSVLMPLDPNDFGAVFSCACSQDQNKALSNTYMELSRAANVVRNRKQQQSSLHCNLKPEEINTTSDHFDYYLDPGHLSAVQWFLEESSDDELILPIEEFKTSNFEQSDFLWPLSVSYVDASAFQQFFVGKTQYENINFQRLKQIDAHCDWQSIDKELHPLP